MNRIKDALPLIEWFEGNYKPEDRKAAALTGRGLRGNVVIFVMYEDYAAEKGIKVLEDDE